MANVINTFMVPGTTQVITVATSSTACTNAFGARTRYLRIATGSVGVWYKIAATPTAAITDTYLPANSVEIIRVAPSQKIAVIQPTTPAGTFSLTELK